MPYEATRFLYFNGFISYKEREDLELSFDGLKSGFDPILSLSP